MTKPFNNIINNTTITTTPTTTPNQITSYVTHMQLDNDSHDNDYIGSASEFIKGKKIRFEGG